MAAQSKTEEKFINYYELLSVPRDAGIKQIQEAYRRLAKEYQDVFQIAPQDFQKLSPEEKFVFEKRTREMQDISNAYGILRNPSTRTVYDRGLDQYLKSQPKPERPIIRTEDIVPREYPGTPTEPVGPEFQIKAPVEERPVFQKLPEAPYQKPAQVTGQVTTPQIAAKQKEPGIAGSAAKQLAGAGAKKVATQAAGKIAAGTAAKAAATRAIGALGGPVGIAASLVIAAIPGLTRKGKELIGGALAWASSGASTFGGALAAGISTIALPSLIPVIIAILVVPFVVAIILFIINSGAYIVPPGPLSFSSRPGTNESEFMRVEKIPRPAGPFQNSQLSPLTVTYDIVITAKRGTLTNFSFSNQYLIFQKPPQIATPPQIDVNALIPPNFAVFTTAPETISYQVRFGSEFRDSIVSDNLTVSADAETAPGVTQRTTATATASILIGNPPEDCPGGWPVRTGINRTYVVTQGPFTTYTHAGREAIDVASGRAVNTTDVVISTHQGTVQIREPDPWGGLYVQIRGTCGGRSFRSWHVHFASFATGINVGSTVQRGTVLGVMGETGLAKGPHDHYEFPDGFPLMENTGNNFTYIPVTVPRGCVGFADCGSITIR